MKRSINLLVSLAITLQIVSAVSLNNSFSEYGIILKFNTILLDYDIETKTGTPEFHGELFVEGTNDTYKDGEYLRRIMPHWTKDNVLRICLQFYDTEQTYEEREMIRWVLTYPPP